MGRLNRPAIMIYGGTIKPGFTHFDGQSQTRDIVSAFQCFGQYLAGKISEEKRKAIVKCSIPGAGACGGQFTANTMAMAVAFLGLAPFGAGDPPAIDPAKLPEGERCGKLAVARAKDYDSGVSLAGYKGSAVEAYAADADAFTTWRDPLWPTVFGILADVQSGAIPQPTIPELIAMLPASPWPS